MTSLAYKYNPVPPPRPKMPFPYVVYICSDISQSKGLLGSKGGRARKKTSYFHAYYVPERMNKTFGIESRFYPFGMESSNVTACPLLILSKRYSV